MAPEEILVVIPARWASSRFPGKPLHPLAGKPMLVHVIERVLDALPGCRTVVATDHEEIRRVAEQHGATAQMTCPEHPSGTDRVAEILEGLSGDQSKKIQVVLNIQGDEPLLPPDNITELIRLMQERADADMATLSTACSPEEYIDPNVVKVVTRQDGRALYFSRAPIPHDRDAGKEEIPENAKKHIGLYAYRPEVLRKLVTLSPSELEKKEKLEQLRALENGFEILVGNGLPSLGVDTPEQAEQVSRILAPEENNPKTSP